MQCYRTISKFAESVCACVCKCPHIHIDFGQKFGCIMLDFFLIHLLVHRVQNSEHIIINIIDAVPSAVSNSSSSTNIRIQHSMNCIYTTRARATKKKNRKWNERESEREENYGIAPLNQERLNKKKKKKQKKYKKINTKS